MISKGNKRDMLIIGGDWNAEVAAGTHTTHPEEVGPYGGDRTTRAGRQLLQFCKEESLKLAGTIFAHTQTEPHAIPHRA